LSALLKSCVEFVEFTKESPSCLEGFLRTYLKSWDGNTNRTSILELVVCLVPTDYEGTFPDDIDIDYRREIMEPLREIFEKGDEKFVIALIECYSRLLSRWANIFGKSFLVGSTPSPLYVLLKY
jgi:hypothetical protein